MNIEELKAERTANLIDALSFKEPKKIPVGAEILSWPFSYAGVRYEDIMDDPVKTCQAYIKYFEAIELDFQWGGGISRSIRAMEEVGNDTYRISEDGSTIVHLQPEIDFMTAEEYPEIIADFDGFVRKMQRKRNKTLQLPRAEAYPKIIAALKHLNTFRIANEMIRTYTQDEKGVIPLTGSPIGYSNPLNILFDHYRGMTDTLIDLKRRPQVVREFHRKMFDQIKERMAKLNPADYSSPYPLGSTVYHCECFLSPQQFDEYYFNDLKEVLMPFLEAGTKIFVKGEGHFLNTIDRYRQLPKGSMVFMLDQDDPFEMYKAIGDWQCLATGITVDLLQLGTVQQCVDYVKRAFDTMAPGGGFIFMPNKPLLCADDAKVENLIAVYKTANELSQQ